MLISEKGKDTLSPNLKTKEDIEIEKSRAATLRNMNVLIRSKSSKNLKNKSN